MGLIARSVDFLRGSPKIRRAHADRLAAWKRGPRIAQIKLLDAILDKVLPVKGESWVIRNKKALQSLSQERSVEKIEANLHRYIEALTLHHVVPSLGGGATDSDMVPQLRTCFHIPNCQVSRFIGREGALANIEHQFHEASTVILQGMGGQGKTQIAREYCRRAMEAKRFSAILWVDALSKNTLKKSFESISELIKPPERVFSDT